MKSPSSPIKKKNGRTFEQMLRTKKFTSRELTFHLRMATSTIAKSIEDPTRLSLGAVFRLADLINEPVETVLSELLNEIENKQTAKLPASSAPQAQATEDAPEEEADEEQAQDENQA
jgi:hypothetical protein